MNASYSSCSLVDVLVDSEEGSAVLRFVFIVLSSSFFAMINDFDAITRKLTCQLFYKIISPEYLRSI